MSINSGAAVNKEVSYLFKKGAKVHIETADNLAVLNKDQRAQFRLKLQEKCKEAEWKEVAKAPYKHHMLFEVDKDEAESTTASTEAADLDIDNLNLADL